MRKDRLKKGIAATFFAATAMLTSGAASASSIQVPRDRNGMFYVTAVIDNRVNVTMMVDTGATHTSIACTSVADALALRLGEAVQTQTFNGLAMARRAHLMRVQIGTLMIDNVEVFVSDQRGGCIVVLGMSALHRLKSMSVQAGVMTLVGEVRK
jgi:clan AA aspartic protease (TIGR02281 family)